MKHTPGEWMVSGAPRNHYVLCTTDFENIIVDEAKAYAKLIAAAPKLLAEGEKTRDLLYEHFDNLPDALKISFQNWRRLIADTTLSPYKTVEL